MEMESRKAIHGRAHLWYLTSDICANFLLSIYGTKELSLLSGEDKKLVSAILLLKRFLLVYLNGDRKSALMLNDSVYDATWLEFIDRLVIHNLLFAETAYSCQGFIEKEGVLYAVQDYVKADGAANIEGIREVLDYNGFKNLDSINKCNLLVESRLV